MAKYQIEVLVEVDTEDEAAAYIDRISSMRPETAVYQFVDRTLQTAHDDAARRQGGFPGWHYVMLEGCVTEIEEDN